MTNENNIEKIGASPNFRSSSSHKKKKKFRFFRNSTLNKSEMSILITGVVILLIVIPLFIFLIDVIRKMFEPVY